MAKSSYPPGRTKENSGLIDLDALDALMREAVPRPSSPSASSSPSAPSLPSSPPAPADDSLQAATLTAPEGRSRSRLRFVSAAVLLFGAGAAAGVAAFRASLDASTAPVTATTGLRTTAPPGHAPAAAAAAAATSAAAAANAERAIDPTSLPSAPPTVERARGAPAKPALGGHAAPDAAASSTSSPPEPERADLTAVDLPASAGPAPGDLAGAMKSAVGPEAAELTSTSEEPTSANARQLRPPPGQVVGAISSVLPSARACLGPDDPVRTGTIVFASDGSVAHVTLQGTRPTDACVRTALSKARVQSFADESFTTRVTVRP